jgi:FkbM family methyltransferase
MHIEKLEKFDISTYCLEKGFKSIVKVGSNDGVRCDTFHAFMKNTPDLRGLFVEPLSQFLERAKENYKGYKNITYKNIAIAEEKGELPFYRLDDKVKEYDPKVPSYYSLISSFKIEHIYKHFGDKYNDFIVVDKVPTDTLMNVLIETGFCDTEILQIDTEGYDYYVLRQLDFKKTKPKLIFFEWNHLPMPERVAAVEFLSPFYEVFSLGPDYVCFLK